MDSDEMRDYILNFSLDKCKRGNQGYNRVLLQLFGFMGHGKSSFINSCKYVIDNGPYKQYAETAEGGGAKTMVRKAYPLTEIITLVDNRGCSKMNKDEIGEIYAQLGNFIPLNTNVEWQQHGFNSAIQKLLCADREDRSADFIVPLFVYSAQAGMSYSEFPELKEILDTAKKITGLMPIVVITHELSPHLENVKSKFREMGVKFMFPLENYTKKDHLKTRGKHETILRCLYNVIKDVEFRMGEERDPIGEKIERKNILFNFIHEREKEKAVWEAQCKAREEMRNAYQTPEPAQKESSCIVQ